MQHQQNTSIITNSEEIHEIITAVPSWIIRWGITLVFLILCAIILLSALIQYPDVVKVGLRINSSNSPKVVLAKQSGKLTSLLVQDGQMVTKDQPLAFLESVADANDILKVHGVLKNIQRSIFSLNSSSLIELPQNLTLGELQANYQSFYLEHLQYKSTLKGGNYLKNITFLEKNLHNVEKHKLQILMQKQVELQEYANAENEYKMYQQLYLKKVISKSEFVQQENKYLASKRPLQQTEAALLDNTINYTAKEKELSELKNTISQQQGKYVQALNKCITECEEWIQKYILRAPFAGRLSYAGIVQQSQNILNNQEVFIINPGNTDYFGEIKIPQTNMGKIHIGERVLVKLQSYPFEQYGAIRGKLTYVSDLAYVDSVFIGKVSFKEFENKDLKNKIILKNGLLGTAEIITEESSLLQRFFWNIKKMMDNRPS